MAVDLSDIHLALIHSHSKFDHVFLSLWISLIIFAYDILLGWMCCNLSNMQSRHRYGMGSTNLTRPNAFWSSTTLWTEPYGNVMADIPTCHFLLCQITYLLAFSTEFDNRGVYSPRYPNVWCLSECSRLTNTEIQVEEGIKESTHINTWHQIWIMDQKIKSL